MVPDKIHNNVLRDICLEHFNEPMLTGWQLVRCVGYAESETNSYIICESMEGVRYKSMIGGGYTFLNSLTNQNAITNYEGDLCNDLSRLDEMLTKTGVPRAETFMVHLTSE